jgi:hypothetical protein
MDRLFFRNCHASKENWPNPNPGRYSRFPTLKTPSGGTANSPVSFSKFHLDILPEA